MPEPLDPDVAAMRRRLGNRLRQLREQAGLSQEQLGERAGVDRKTINRVEGGITTPWVDHLFLLAKALGVEPVELFRW